MSAQCLYALQTMTLSQSISAILYLSQCDAAVTWKLQFINCMAQNICLFQLPWHVTSPLARKFTALIHQDSTKMPSVDTELSQVIGCKSQASIDNILQEGVSKLYRQVVC